MRNDRIFRREDANDYIAWSNMNGHRPTYPYNSHPIKRRAFGMDSALHRPHSNTCFAARPRDRRYSASNGKLVHSSSQRASSPPFTSNECAQFQGHPMNAYPDSLPNHRYDANKNPVLSQNALFQHQRQSKDTQKLELLELRVRRLKAEEIGKSEQLRKEKERLLEIIQTKETKQDELQRENKMLHLKLTESLKNTEIKKEEVGDRDELELEKDENERIKALKGQRETERNHQMEHELVDHRRKLKEERKVLVIMKENEERVHRDQQSEDAILYQRLQSQHRRRKHRIDDLEMRLSSTSASTTNTTTNQSKQRLKAQKMKFLINNMMQNLDEEDLSKNDCVC